MHVQAQLGYMKSWALVMMQDITKVCHQSQRCSMVCYNHSLIVVLDTVLSIRGHHSHQGSDITMRMGTYTMLMHAYFAQFYSSIEETSVNIGLGLQERFCIGVCKSLYPYGMVFSPIIQERFCVPLCKNGKYLFIDQNADCKLVNMC